MSAADRFGPLICSKAQLIAAELVKTATHCARTPSFDLACEVKNGRLRIAVRCDLPISTNRSLGLQVIGHVADSFGQRIEEATQIIWADLTVPGARKKSR